MFIPDTDIFPLADPGSIDNKKVVYSLSAETRKKAKYFVGRQLKKKSRDGRRKL
jgi:hypothetical protein